MDTEQRVVLEGRIDARTAPAYRDALASATPKLPRGNVGRWAKTRRDQATGDMS